MIHHGIISRFQSFLKGRNAFIMRAIGLVICLAMMKVMHYIGKHIRKSKYFLISFIILLCLKTILLGKKIGQKRSIITILAYLAALRMNLLFKIIWLRLFFMKRKIVNYVRK